MLFLHHRSALPCVLLLAAALAGCSADQDPERAAARTEEPVRQFSEEERLAARALSISNRGTVQEADNPYDQAVICSSAIEALADRLRQSDVLSGEQLQIVEQAKAVYDRRIRILADRASAAAIGSDEALRQIPEGTPPGGQALLAVGCIQKLAEAG